MPAPLLGYAVGGASVTAPRLFQKWRLPRCAGKLTGLNEVAIVIGQLAAFAINAIIGIIWGPSAGRLALYAAGTS
ncbi:MFS transporter [Klebsiella pneumoniae subsp. pneumoniae]|nr:MFS transporter [Klebsiella pneumoniae subsp. pneumoniae]